MQSLVNHDAIAHETCRTRLGSDLLTANGRRKLDRGHPAPRRQRKRPGWTLIEMLVTLAVMGTLTGIAVKTLTSMLLAEHRGVEHVSQLATLARMARTFRNDIHLATNVQISTSEPQKPLLLLTMNANHHIQYETQPLGLLRTDRRANQPVGRELWRLKPAHFQCLDSAGTPRLLTLVVGIPQPHPAGTTATAPLLKELHIDAIVGRDLDQPTNQ